MLAPFSRTIAVRFGRGLPPYSLMKVSIYPYPPITHLFFYHAVHTPFSSLSGPLRASLLCAWQMQSWPTGLSTRRVEFLEPSPPLAKPIGKAHGIVSFVSCFNKRCQSTANSVYPFGCKVFSSSKSQQKVMEYFGTSVKGTCIRKVYGEVGFSHMANDIWIVRSLFIHHIFRINTYSFAIIIYRYIIHLSWFMIDSFMNIVSFVSCSLVKHLFSYSPTPF